MEKETMVEAHDHAGNKVMIPWSEAMMIHEHMEKHGKKPFDAEHYLDKAREKMQEADYDNEYPDTEEKIKEGFMRNLGMDSCEAEYLEEAIEAIVAHYLKMALK